MKKNPVLECIYSRRSVRDYLGKKVPKELIEELLNAAVMAPSARNRQPWNFSIVEDREKIAKYGEIALKDKRVSELWARIRLTRPGAAGIFYNAPLLIVISGESDWKWLKEDVNLAVQNMFLAANSLGLGSCWIGMGKGLNESKEAREGLGIPYSFEIAALLIFGYPAKVSKEIPKREPKILKWIK